MLPAGVIDNYGDTAKANLISSPLPVVGSLTFQVFLLQSPSVVEPTPEAVLAMMLT